MKILISIFFLTILNAYFIYAGGTFDQSWLDITGFIKVEWNDNGDSTNFTMKCDSLVQNSYCAFGLSNDQYMVF